MKNQSISSLCKPIIDMLRNGAISSDEYKALRYCFTFNNFDPAIFLEYSLVYHLCGSEILDILINRINASTCLDLVSTERKLQLINLLSE